MKTRQKRFLTTASALIVALFGLASAPTGAMAVSSTPFCQYIAGCVGHCNEDLCSVVNCDTKCLKSACEDDQDAFVCKN